MHPIPSPRSLLAGRFLLTIANAAACVISLRRLIVQRHQTDDECVEAGLPVGSREAALHVSPVQRASWWRVAAWLDNDDNPKGCLHLDAFGWEAEVYYYRPGQGPDSAARNAREAFEARRATA